MKKQFKMVVLLVVVLLGLFAFSGCASTNPATALALDVQSPIMVAGEEITLPLSVTFEKEVDAEKHGQLVQKLEVAFTSDNPAVATVDATGKVAAVGVGTANITAAAGEFSASVQVQVFQPLTDLVLSQSDVTVVEGESAVLTVEPSANAQLAGLTATSDNPVIALVTVDEATKTVTVQGVGAGSAVVEIVSGEITKIIPVDVKHNIEAITFEKTEGILNTGLSYTLVPAITPEGAEVSFTFVSSDEAVATVDDKGVVTAVGVGTATITVSIEGYDVTAEYLVTVKKPAPASTSSGSGRAGSGSGGGAGGTDGTGGGAATPADSGGAPAQTDGGGGAATPPSNPGNLVHSITGEQCTWAYHSLLQEATCYNSRWELWLCSTPNCDMVWQKEIEGSRMPHDFSLWNPVLERYECIYFGCDVLPMKASVWHNGATVQHEREYGQAISPCSHHCCELDDQAAENSFVMSTMKDQHIRHSGELLPSVQPQALQLLAYHKFCPKAVGGMEMNTQWLWFPSKATICPPNILKRNSAITEISKWLKNKSL